MNLDLTTTFFCSSRSFVCGEKVWLLPLLVLGYQRLVFTGGDAKIDCQTLGCKNCEVKPLSTKAFVISVDMKTVAPTNQMAGGRV